jgi:soluble lytic murein transglycosylase-like protein
MIYTKAYAQDVPETTEIYAKPTKSMQTGNELVDLPPESIHQKIDRHADAFGIPRKSLHALVRCESSYNPTARNLTKAEDSRGLVQINMWAHKVTVAEANDPDFALSFAGKHWGERKSMWYNCVRKLGI